MHVAQVLTHLVEERKIVIMKGDRQPLHWRELFSAISLHCAVGQRSSPRCSSVRAEDEVFPC